MRSTASVDDTLRYLQEGGAVGRHLLSGRADATALGPPAGWPQALHDTLRITLHSDFPHIVYWGEALHTFWNDAARHFFEGQHPQDLGRPLAQVQPDVMPTLHPLLQTVLHSGRAVSRSNQQLLYRRLDYTEEIHEFFSYSPLLDAQGQVQGVICPIYDATSRVINERRLATLADLAASTRATRTRTQFLAALAACLARHPEDLPLAALYLSEDDGASWQLQTASPADAPWPSPLGLDALDHELAPLLRRAFDTGEPAAAAAAAAPLGGWPTPRWTHPVEQLVAQPVPVGRLGRRSAGLLIGLNPHKRLDADYRAFLALVAAQIGLGWNDAQALEQEAELAQAELARLTRLTTLGELATSIAHEVNQPLTAMVLDANACLRWLNGLEGRDNATAKLAEARAAAQRIIRSGEHAGQVVARIRGLLQRAPAVRAPVPPAALAWDCLPLVAARARRQRTRLRLCLPAQLPTLLADRVQLQQVLLNLLVNALDAVRDLPANQPREVRLSLARLATPVPALQIHVLDSGRGVPASQRPHLFEPFHSSKPDGLGFGLSIARTLVEAHGGQIRLDDGPGGGTLAQVVLPLQER